MGEDKNTLLSLYEDLKQARVALGQRDYAIFQGVLTGIYNSLAGLTQSSTSLPEDRRARLTALNEFVFDTREGIVEQIEVNRRGLETAISITHANERLDLLKEILQTWIAEWYKTLILDPNLLPKSFS